MAWTSPRTWVVGETVTAALMNTHVRDNLDYLYANATFVKVSDTTLGADTASFDITSIAATYAHLRIVALLRGTTVATRTSPYLRFNNDSGANYRDPYGAAQNQIQLSDALPAASADANVFGPYTADIISYAQTGKMRAVALSSGYSISAGMVTTTGTGLWTNTADAINRVTLSPAANNWLAGSRFTLYATED